MFDHPHPALPVNKPSSLRWPLPVDESVPHLLDRSAAYLRGSPRMADLRELIGLRKADRSYEQLSKACGGNPSAPRLHQLVTTPIKGFPDPETIRGLSRGLGVTEMTVVLAAAESLGLDMQMPGGDGWAALLPAGTARIPSHFRDAILTVVHSAIQLIDDAQAVASPDEPQQALPTGGTPLRPVGDDTPRVVRAARKRPRPPNDR